MSHRNRPHWLVINVYLRIYTYSSVGESCRVVRIRSRSNRKFYLKILIRTNFVVSKRAVKLWQIASLELRLSWPYHFNTQHNMARITSYLGQSVGEVSRSATIWIVNRSVRQQIAWQWNHIIRLYFPLNWFELHTFDLLHICKSVKISIDSTFVCCYITC